MPLLLHAEGAGLEPGHVEQIADEAIEPLRLLRDRFRQLSPGSIADLAHLIPKSAGRARDRGEGCAQVVRDAAQERTPSALSFDLSLNLTGILGEAAAFERERREAGESPDHLHPIGIE